MKNIFFILLAEIFITHHHETEAFSRIPSLFRTKFIAPTIIPFHQNYTQETCIIIEKAYASSWQTMTNYTVTHQNFEAASHAWRNQAIKFAQAINSENCLLLQQDNRLQAVIPFKLLTNSDFFTTWKQARIFPPCITTDESDENNIAFLVILLTIQHFQEENISDIVFPEYILGHRNPKYINQILPKIIKKNTEQPEGFVYQELRKHLKKNEEQSLLNRLINFLKKN